MSGAASVDLGVIIDNLPYMMKGLKVTFILAFGSMFGSFVGGTMLAILRLSPFRLLRWPAAIYVDVVRSIPAIMANNKTQYETDRFTSMSNSKEAGISTSREKQR